MDRFCRRDGFIEDYTMLYWFYLFLAIVLEVAGTTAMKLSEGFARVLPSIMIFVFYGLSFAGLTLALKKIEVSVAYAIWSGLGTALITAIGLLYFREPVTLIKIASIALIILGVAGLNLDSWTH
ncbi:MAG: multidrug efflux SMR transporter [Desulfosalsimonadaceae bacterium]